MVLIFVTDFYVVSVVSRRRTFYDILQPSRQRLIHWFNPKLLLAHYNWSFWGLNELAE